MARDKIHYIVIAALIKDGWDITHDPLRISFDINEKDFEIDVGAEKLIGAEKENLQIAVEIKSFLASITNDFHGMLGQYIDYRAALAADMEHDNRNLYIALPEEVYARISRINFFNQRISDHNLKFVTINLEMQTVVEWIE